MDDVTQILLLATAELCRRDPEGAARTVGDVLATMTSEMQAGALRAFVAALLK